MAKTNQQKSQKISLKNPICLILKYINAIFAEVC